MKIKFNGALEKREKGGCKPCGRKGRSETTFVTTRQYILPSGITKTFHVGVEEEVDDRDGNFLLSYNAPDVNGHMRQVFEEVK